VGRTIQGAQRGWPGDDVNVSPGHVVQVAAPVVEVVPAGQGLQTAENGGELVPPGQLTHIPLGEIAFIPALQSEN
jgi:hypothetical protein